MQCGRGVESGKWQVASDRRGKKKLNLQSIKLAEKLLVFFRSELVHLMGVLLLLNLLVRSLFASMNGILGHDCSGRMINVVRRRH